MSAENLLDYDALKALADHHGRPVSTLITLASQNDPFSITPARRTGAEWFARIWKRLNLGRGAHLRRVHYALISQKKPIRLPHGKPYENTIECWDALGRASNDARYLDLVPAEHFVDRRNAEPLIHLSSGESKPGSLNTIFSEPWIETAAAHFPYLPQLLLSPPHIPQPYHIELWCEKTTVNDVLEGLALQFDLNVITGAGELSQTACINLVERAVQSARPVRVLYISDFDPAGMSMPVAVARKIEHRLALKQLDLDIQVRPIALTLEQCRRYRLPRTPIKETEARRAGFEQRYGEGATELDALEALHPGELSRIIETEITRYYDSDLNGRIRETAAETQRELADINRQVRDQHHAETEALESEWAEIAAEHERRIEQWREHAKPVWRAVAKNLKKRSPDPDKIDWPEPKEADEDSDPLFDSSREYVEQIDRYKRHQGKPTARRNGGTP